MRLSPDMYGRARDLIASRLGLDFPEQRQADLERGLMRACRTSSVSAPEAYLAWLATLPEVSPDWRRLAGYLTVGETYFFRDRACFEALEQQVLPSLIAASRAEGIPRLRLWSAACATGEEPYSLAILLDGLLPDRSDWGLTILATDINLEALEKAQRGRYREWPLRETPQWIQERYFRRHGADTLELDPRIRRMVTFAPLNLAEDGYPTMVTNTSAMDLIVCRNVLMYFTREAQRATVARLQRALLPGGWLVVSPAEASTDLFHPLLPVNLPGAIFYRKEPAGGQGLGVGGWGLGTDAHPPTRGPYPLPSVMLRTGVRGQGAASESLEAEDQSCGAGKDRDEQELIPIPQPPAPYPRPLLEQARARADQGELEQARRLCEAALARDRLDPEAHLLLAAICQERSEIPAALEALRRAIYLAPDSAPAHFLLGSLLLRQGDPRRGRRAMETVVRLLSPVPRDEVVPGSDGLTAGRLLETVRAYLEWRG